MPLLAALVFFLVPGVAAETPPFERVDRVNLNSGENQLFSAVITPDGTRGLFASGITNLPIVEVDLVDMQRVRAITTPPNLGFFAAVIDPAGDFAYFGTGGSNVPRISRIALADGTLVEGAQQADSTTTLGAAVIDPDGRYAYFAQRGSTHRIFRYRLFDDGSADAPPWNDSTLTGPGGGTAFTSAVIDPDGRYAYFGTGSTLDNPGRVVRVEIRDAGGDPVFKDDGHLLLESNENRLVAAVMDPSGDHAYFAIAPATGTGSGSVVKVDLRTFARVGAVDVNVGGGLLTTAVIDPAGEFAYFGTSESPARVHRVQLGGAVCAGGGTACGGMSVVDTITLDSGENHARSAVVAPDGRFAYFGTNTSPGRVVRVRIADDPPPPPPPPPVTSESASGPGLPAVSCGPAVLSVGTTVTCTVMGGDPGIDILWRAAYNPVFAEAGVTLDATGAGEFSFVIPAEALGEEVTVELVEWLVPVSLGVVGGAVPVSIPAGGGAVPVPVWPLVMLALAGGLVLRRVSTFGVRG